MFWGHGCDFFVSEMCRKGLSGETKEWVGRLSVYSRGELEARCYVVGPG